MHRIIVLLATLAAASNAVAQGLAEPGKSWVQIASTNDLNTAIGIARLYTRDGIGDYVSDYASGRVVSSKDGFYAVVVGPVTAKTIEAYRSEREKDQPGLPADAVMTSGAGYRRAVWQGDTALATDADYPVDVGDHMFSASITTDLDDDDNPTIHVAASDNTRRLFAIDIDSGDMSSVGLETTTIMRLDKATRWPQIVMAYYTGGAHCCDQTWIVTEAAPGKWTPVDAGALYGGYSFEDIDGDGTAEMVSIREDFMYLDGYLNGPAPLFFSKLSGAQVVDISRSPLLRDRYLQEVAGLEFWAAVDPTRWHDNQFLAAWVTDSALAGRLTDAWAKAMQLYDHSVLVGDYCETPPPAHDCDLSFPEEMSRLLQFYHLGHPNALPTPRLRPSAVQ